MVDTIFFPDSKQLKLKGIFIPFLNDDTPCLAEINDMAQDMEILRKKYAFLGYHELR